MESKLNKKDHVSPGWLTDELIGRIRTLYEPRYQRRLSLEEIITIAISLSTVVSIYLKVKRRKEYGV